MPAVVGRRLGVAVPSWRHLLTASIWWLARRSGGGDWQSAHSARQRARQCWIRSRPPASPAYGLRSQACWGAASSLGTLTARRPLHNASPTALQACRRRSAHRQTAPKPSASCRPGRPSPSAARTSAEPGPPPAPPSTLQRSGAGGAGAQRQMRWQLAKPVSDVYRAGKKFCGLQPERPVQQSWARARPGPSASNPPLTCTAVRSFSHLPCLANTSQRVAYVAELPATPASCTWRKGAPVLVAPLATQRRRAAAAASAVRGVLAKACTRGKARFRACLELSRACHRSGGTPSMKTSWTHPLWAAPAPPSNPGTRHHVLKHRQRAVRLVGALHTGDHGVVADGVGLQALDAAAGRAAGVSRAKRSAAAHRLRAAGPAGVTRSRACSGCRARPVAPQRRLGLAEVPGAARPCPAHLALHPAPHLLRAVPVAQPLAAGDECADRHNVGLQPGPAGGWAKTRRLRTGTLWGQCQAKRAMATTLSCDAKACAAAALRADYREQCSEAGAAAARGGMQKQPPIPLTLTPMACMMSKKRKPVAGAPARMHAAITAVQGQGRHRPGAT